MVRPAPLPLRTDFRDATPYIKAATGLLIGAVRNEPATAVIRRTYGDDPHFELITRAAVETDTTTSLADLTQTSGLQKVSVLGPGSAGFPLLNTTGAVTFTFDNNLGIYIANIVAASGNAGFGAENSVIPVRQLLLDNTTLKPVKLAVIVPFTREVIEHSVPNLETMVRTALADSTALQFDTALLDDSMATSARPAGLRQGIAGSTASDSTVRNEAMMEDLQTLIGSVAAVANNGPIAIVASPQKEPRSGSARRSRFPIRCSRRAGLHPASVARLPAIVW